MKITLKNVKINLAFSEETTMFKADVYVDGIEVAYAENDGHGGSTFYHQYDQSKKDLLAKAEKYCKKLPKRKIEGLERSFDMDLEQVIDDLVFEEMKKKEWKKIEKKMVNAIMYGKPDFTGTYYEVKFRVPLAQIPTTQLQDIINKHKAKMKAGDIFWNNNLVALGITI